MIYNANKTTKKMIMYHVHGNEDNVHDNKHNRWKRLRAKNLRSSVSRKLSSAAFNEVSTSPVAFRTFSLDTFAYSTHTHTHTRTTYVTVHEYIWPRILVSRHPIVKPWSDSPFSLASRALVLFTIGLNKSFGLESRWKILDAIFRGKL